MVKRIHASATTYTYKLNSSKKMNSKVISTLGPNPLVGIGHAAVAIVVVLMTM